MPDVISLLSSTPPPPADRLEPPSSLRRFHSSPPGPAGPALFSIVSDDIEQTLFAYDDDLEKPKKKRRLSHDTVSPKPTTAKPSPNPLFLFSDDIALSSDGPPKPKTTLAWTELESDPIVFTSSAPENLSKKGPVRQENDQRRANAITIDDDIIDSFCGTTAPKGSRNWKNAIGGFGGQIPFSDPPSDIFDLSEDEIMANKFSSRTANLLASLGDRSNVDKGDGSAPTTKAKSRQKKDNRNDDEDCVDEVPEPRNPARKPRTQRTTTNPDKEAKAREREAAKAQRERERQLEKERKQKLKEEKAKERQLAADIAEANKLKVDKKDSTREMIVDLASTIEETSTGNQVVEYMKRLDVEHTFFTSSIPNIVKWRRKMVAKYNDSLGYWEPCPLQIREEEHVLCLLRAQEFVDMAIAPLDPLSDEPSELELHVLQIKRAYPGCTVIYLIEGLTAWMRKNTNSRNRAYQAELRRQLDQVQGTNNSASESTVTTTTSSRKKAKKPETTPPVDDDTIEDALLQLQVAQACLVHHTNAAPESAEWIKNFTEHVSTVPYRRERLEGNDSAFCMDGGQVKPGENKCDTFLKMLQEVNRVTASMAYGVTNQYPSVLELVQGMRKHGPAMLEDVKKSANRNGGVTDSRIGPAASKRLYKVFMGLDPSSTDV